MRITAKVYKITKEFQNSATVSLLLPIVNYGLKYLKFKGGYLIFYNLQEIKHLGC